MTPARRRSLARYIARTAADLGLRDWTLNFHDEPPSDPDAMASMDSVYGRKIANIYVCSDFDHQPPESQRAAVLHELIHVHFAHERQVVSDLIDGLGSEARTVASDAYRLGHEFGVDGLAEAIAHFFPLWEM